MVLALLLALATTTVSGMMVLAIEENAGPLAGLVATRDARRASTALIPAAQADEDEHEGKGEAGEEFWEEVHEVSANASLALVLLHIAGVFASSLAHRENLPRAMVTGRKRADR
jgi:cytochrome b